MTQPAEFIDRIVAGVLEQLQVPAAARSSTPEITAPPQTARSVVEISDDVVTGPLLEERGICAGPIVFAAKSVLTPSAREFLARRKIDWTFSKNGQPGSSNSGAAKWLAIVVRATPAVSAALETLASESSTHWSREIVGCHREAAGLAVGALCRGECDGVVVITGKPEAVACRANRNPKVRAAPITTVLRMKTLQEELGANLFAVDPSDRSAFELRNILRKIGAGRPSALNDWNE
jgi:hypothetical protein